MSGETESNVSAWTIDSLHSHVKELINRDRESLNERLTRERDRLEERWATQTRAIDAAFAAADKAVTAAMAASEKAVDKAEAAATRRFEAVNEFRASLADLSSLMMTRTETGALMAGVEARMTLMTEANTQAEDRLVARITILETRQAGTTGATLGATEANAMRQRSISLMISLAAVTFTFIGLALSVLIATGR